MEIVNIESFLSYYEKTRTVTKKVIAVIPRDRMDFTYMPGKFTIADLVRHIAAIERHLYAEVAQGKKSCYRGCGKELADGYDAVLAFFDIMHSQSVAIFRSFGDDALNREIAALDGRRVLLKNFLRALIVHEIHHRGALCIYLNLLGVSTPQVFGIREEEVRALSKSPYDC